MGLDQKRDHHILSYAIIENAIVNTVCAFMIFYCRKAMAGEAPAFLPMMQDDVIWNDQKVISAVQLIASAVIFAAAWYRFGRRKRCLKTNESISESFPHEGIEYANTATERTEIESRESGKKRNLSIQSTGELLEIWAAIILGIGFIYDISAEMYRKFILQIGSLIGAERSSEIEEAVVAVYNGSHGFKYVGMFTAIILGIVVTAVFLKDKKLIMAAVMLTIIFMVAFAYVNMQTVTISGNQYGIVWTSVIFHALETLGLLVMGFYLKRGYVGI